MGFFDSKIFQDLLAGTILVYFLLYCYSAMKRQKLDDTMQQIKDWYNGLDGDDEE